MIIIHIFSLVTIPTPDPDCDTGIRSGDICCASSCGSCGGSGCGGLPGGGDNCCKGGISSSGRSCLDHPPPCVVTEPAHVHHPEFVNYTAAREAAISAAADTVWIDVDPTSGDLVYGVGPGGSKVPDFSHVGYHSGELPLPSRSRIPMLASLYASTTASDDSARIQAALDAAGAGPLDADGYRGAVELGPGTFRLSVTVYIRSSGVVLRGAGAELTTLLGTTRSQYNLVEVIGSSRPGIAGTASLTAGRVIDADVPVGATGLRVADPSAFARGEVVFVAVPTTTAAFVATTRMDKICADDPGDQQWEVGYRHYNADPDPRPEPDDAFQAARSSVLFERVVIAIDPATSTLRFNVPIMNPIVAEYGGAWVFPAVNGVAGAWPTESRSSGSRVSHAAVEDLTLDCEYEVGQEDSDELHAWSGVAVDNAEHSFVRGIRCRHMGDACVKVGRGGIYITVEDAASETPVSLITGERRYTFATDGQMVLFQNLSSDRGRHDYVSGRMVAGPNVWHSATSTNMQNDIGPHFHWAAGQLYDGITASAEAGGQFSVQNRGPLGAGHGWSGNAVIFFNCASQCTSSTGSCRDGFRVDTPAGGTGSNWCIGCVADTRIPEDLYRGGYAGNTYGLTTPCAPDFSDRPYQCCVASRLPPLAVNGGDPQVYSAGGHWQSKGQHLDAVPSLYLKQLRERVARATPPPEVTFIDNLVNDPSFEDQNAGSGGGDSSWTAAQAGFAFTSDPAEVRSGIAAVKIGAGGEISQTIQLAASEGLWPTSIRIRGCSQPLLVTGCGADDATGCSGYSVGADATLVGGGSMSVTAVRFDPTAPGYHCRTIMVNNMAGIQQVVLRAKLAGTVGAGAAVFDDFDAAVVAPHCWGARSFCRGVRTTWGTLSFLLTVYVNPLGDDLADGLSPATALRSLSAAASVLNGYALGGVVAMASGTYDIESTATFRVPVSVHGEGAHGDDATVLRAGAGIAYTWILMTPLNHDATASPGTLQGVRLRDLRFDLASVPHASGVMLGFVNDVAIERCAFVNVALGWALHVGQLNPPHNPFLTTIVNTNIGVRDTLFDGLSGTLEMLLLTNARGVEVERCTFRNSSQGNAVGVYQWTDGVTIKNCTFDDVHVGVYFTRSCNNTLVEASLFTDCRMGIRGALQSDNDCTDIVGNPANEATYPFCVTAPGADYAVVFGVSHAHNLTVRSTAFKSTQYTALEIGAVHSAVVENCTFETGGTIAVSISRGGLPVDEPNVGVDIRSCFFASSNNQERQHHLIHPAILVTGPQPGFGLRLENCTFEFAPDEQIFGVTFAGNHAYGDVCIRRNEFAAVAGAAAFGARGVIFEGNGVVQDAQLAPYLLAGFNLCDNTVNGVTIGPYGGSEMASCGGECQAAL